MSEIATLAKNLETCIEACWIYPKAIFDLRKQLLDAQKAVQLAKREQAVIEAALFEKMLDDTTLSNDAKRKSGLAKLHRESTELQEVLKRLETSQRQISNLEIDIDAARDRRRAQESTQTATIELLRLYQATKPKEQPNEPTHHRDN